jgi:Mn-dependent DtxR family transcriptional regulator
MKKESKTTRKLERIVKGFSNHRRIEIMMLLEKEPETSVWDIADKLNIHYKTASEHVRRLAIAGLILKRNFGNKVLSRLTDNGKSILKFLRTLE